MAISGTQPNVQQDAVLARISAQVQALQEQLQDNRSHTQQLQTERNTHTHELNEERRQVDAERQELERKLKELEKQEARVSRMQVHGPRTLHRGYSSEVLCFVLCILFDKVRHPHNTCLNTSVMNFSCSICSLRVLRPLFSHPHLHTENVNPGGD